MFDRNYKLDLGKSSKRLDVVFFFLWSRWDVLVLMAASRPNISANPG